MLLLPRPVAFTRQKTGCPTTIHSLMSEPHNVPLPASRGSLDSVRGHESHQSVTGASLRSGQLAEPLQIVDEGENGDGDDAWFPDSADQEQPTEEEEELPAEDAAPRDGDEADEREHVDASGDGPDPPPPVDDAAPYDGDADDRMRALEDELERTRADRDAWEEQYQALLAKLTTMRNTVGDKLRQDAVS